MTRFLKTAGWTVAAYALVALLQPAAAQAQFVQVYSSVVAAPVVPCPPVTVHYAPALVAPAPVVSYYQPVVAAPTYSYSFYQPATTVYSAPLATTVYSAPTTVYSPAVTVPSTVTTRSYRGFGIFRPRGVYTQTTVTPSGSLYTPLGTTSYYTPLFFRY